jgi:hypothetical protein
MKTASKIVMSIAGLFLIVASCFKVYQLLTVPLPAEPLIDTWLFSVIQIPLELGLGIWLVSGLFKKAGWLIALIGYGCFIGVTSWRFATGQESCGCFGSFHVDPKITLFTIDIPVFLGLAIFRPKNEKFLPPPWPNTVHFFIVSILTAIILSAIVPTIIFNKSEAVIIDVNDWLNTTNNNSQKQQPPKPEPDDPNNNVHQPPPVEPEPIPDKPPKIVDSNSPAEEPNQPDNKDTEKKPEPAQMSWENVLELIGPEEIADAIRTDIKITVLHRHDCQNCHEALPLIEKYANEFGTDEDSIRIVLIELPPFGKSKEYEIPEDTKCLQGKYTGKELFVATPVIVLTLDGEAKKVWASEKDFPTFDDLTDAINDAMMDL